MFAALALLIIVVAYRIASGFVGSTDFSWMHNFAPLAAVALCGAVYLPRRFAFALPLTMLFLSDLVLNVFHYHQPLATVEILPRYLALALIAGLGLALQGKARLGSLLAASVGGSVAFYVITNTGSWLYEPGYARNVGGWLQALTRGLPGYPATWTFYVNTLLSDVGFTLLFVGCMAWQAGKHHADEPEVLAPW
ncbi:MAG: hypothetical protein K8R23_00370 [Chthoniobacter sp.]|nr:hypothetical protein [Chthoniobacter sp.]